VFVERGRKFARLAGLAIGAGLLAVSAFGATEVAADPAAPLYASGTVVEIDLDLSQESIEALEAEPEEYVPGDITVAFTDGTPGGVTAKLHPLKDVGVRLKGNVEGSFRPIGDKAAFKLKFNEFVKGQKLLGLKKMTLNNMVQDPTMLHEALAYEAFRAAGVPAPRTGYAFIRVNGTAYGVYANVETYDDVSLIRRFGDFDDETQHLYEGEYEDEVTPGGASAFEVDEGDDEDIADLEALIGAVNAPSPAFHTRVEGFADLAEMRRMWAVEKYVVMWDGYAGTNFAKLPNNFYLYSSPTGEFQMFPWGTDQALEGGSLDFAGDAGLMFDECVADAACLSAYVDDLRLIGGTIAGLELESLADCLVNRLAPWRAMEGPPFREYEPAQVQHGLEKTYEVLKERPEELIEWLESQTSQTEELTPTGSPASCAIPEPPEVEPEPEPKPNPKPGPTLEPPVVTVGPAPQGSEPQASMELRDLRLGSPGVLIAVLQTGRAGEARLTGTISNRRGHRRVCDARHPAKGPETLVLRCRLSAADRARLRKRRLNVHLTIGFEPADGSLGVTITRNHVIPHIRRG
jgi:CotH kinase protein